MSSAFDSIITGFVTLLTQNPAVCPFVETDEDENPIPTGRATSILVTLGNADPQQLGGINGNPVDWLTEVRVRCIASANATSARPAANTLANAAYTRLASTPDLALGTGCYIGQPRIEWDVERAATRLAAATLIYTVQHRTAGGILN